MQVFLGFVGTILSFLFVSAITGREINMLDYYSKRKNSISDILLRTILFIYSIIVICPMLWAVLMSLKTNEEFFYNIWGLPTKWMVENYIRAWTTAKMGNYFFNSVLVTIVALSFIIIFASTASYILARIKFKGSSLIFTLYVSGMLIPSMTGLISQYLLLNSIKLVDTRIGLILIYIFVSMAFSVFMLSSFFKTIPGELEESAMIDGCGYNKMFWLIMFPMAKAGVITVSIFNFLSIWNEYAIALTLINSDNKKTLAVGLVNLFSVQQYYTDWSALFAGLIIIMLPVLVVYAIFQNKIIAGITVGAIK